MTLPNLDIFVYMKWNVIRPTIKLLYVTLPLYFKYKVLFKKITGLGNNNQNVLYIQFAVLHDFNYKSQVFYNINRNKQTQIIADK